MTPDTKTEMLKSHAHELVKTYSTYDANNRIEYFYTVIDSAPDGHPCLVTRYSYDGISSRVTYAKEYYGLWDSSWETF